MDLPSLCHLEWSPPSPFIDEKGAQGYMHVLCDVLLGKEELKFLVLSCSWWCITVGGAVPVV
jgi:hypothetical protein